MGRASGHRLVAACILFLVAVAVASGQGVKVRVRDGSARGFLVLRSETGAILASGEFSQIPQGDRVKLRLVFHFKDGSLDEETTVYSQNSTFRLISNRLVQSGRAFPEPCEMTIDAHSQTVSMRALSKPNQDAKTEHMDIPPDLSNGLLFNLIKNLQSNDPEVKVSYLAASPKPRMVKLAIAIEKEGHFTVAARRIKAAVWCVKAELGGLTGIVAPMIGKQPPDTHVWIAEDGVPTIVRVDTALYVGGPVWSIQLASPVW
jgi:hypothetical protein